MLGALSGVLTASFIATSVLGTVRIASANGGEAQVNIGKDSITIGNEFLQRTYSIQDGHILTSSIDNHRINLNTVPGKGSEDFVINTISEGSV